MNIDHKNRQAILFPPVGIWHVSAVSSGSYLRLSASMQVDPVFSVSIAKVETVER